MEMKERRVKTAREVKLDKQWSGETDRRWTASQLDVERIEQ
jgi:hypothetical protein